MFVSRVHQMREIFRPPPELVYHMPLTLSATHAKLVITLYCDAEAEQFLIESCNHCPSVIFCLLKPVLVFCWSSVDVNGWFGEGLMHVLSTSQLQCLLRMPDNFRYPRILDIGAGDGNVSRHFLPLCSEVFIFFVFAFYL